jgi:Fumarylacetoacetate (FAA) hydrolase family
VPDLLPGRANYRQHNPEWIEREEFGRIENLELQLSVNGQCDNASALVFKAAETISELSTFANVAPGDVLLTGTPSASALRVPPRPRGACFNCCPRASFGTCSSNRTVASRTT